MTDQTLTEQTYSNADIIPYVILVIIIIWLLVHVVMALYREGYLGKGTKSKAAYNGTGKATPVYQHSKMHIRQWLKLVNEERDMYPHLWIVAKTGSGKTEMAKAILSQRTGKVLILDPKATPNKWGSGVQAIGINDDLTYTHIDTALDLVLRELQTRQRALSSGSTSFEPLTLVIDELTTLAMFSKKVPDVFTKVSVIGRELGVRLIAISQSDRVASLGLEGKGDIREQYLYLALGNKARELVPNLSGRYVAVAKFDNHVTELDVSQVMRYASLGITPSQVHQLAYDVLTVSCEQEYEQVDPVDPVDPVETRQGMTTLSTEETVAITSMLLSGHSGNAIAKSNKVSGSRNDRLAKIKLVREQLGMTDTSTDLEMSDVSEGASN